MFDCVLAEAISTLARRTHEKRRTAQLPALLAQLKAEFPTKSILWLYPDLPNLYDEVVALVEQTDGELNFNDALIALSCRNRNISCLAVTAQPGLTNPGRRLPGTLPDLSIRQKRLSSYAWQALQILTGWTGSSASLPRWMQTVEGDADCCVCVERLRADPTGSFIMS